MHWLISASVFHMLPEDLQLVPALSLVQDSLSENSLIDGDDEKHRNHKCRYQCNRCSDLYEHFNSIAHHRFSPRACLELCRSDSAALSSALFMQKLGYTIYQKLYGRAGRVLLTLNQKDRLAAAARMVRLT
jgi:hypothetical protein